MTHTERIAALEAAIAAQQQSLDAARAEIARLRAEQPDEAAVSRRDWLRRTALAGGALVAAEAVSATPAAAQDGNALVAGGQVNAEHTTTLFADYNPGAAYLNGIFHVTDTSFADEATATPGLPLAAVTGYATHTNGGTAGVVGVGLVIGLYGEVTGANGRGVAGVAGDVNGWGVYGSGGLHGVHGEGVDTGVYGTGASVGVYGESTLANGYGVFGQTGSSGGAGVSGSGDTGVLGDGNVYGVHATAGATGIPLRANITQSANASSALYASTPGKGAGVKGTSTGGVGLLGTGVRGGSFGGTAAAFTARPGTGSTHPSSGATGDFYVDTAHRLWFCHGGTSWKQLA